MNEEHENYTELAQCPFCGGDAIIKEYSTGGLWMISCSGRCGVLMTGEASCKARGKQIGKEIKEKVIQNWNRRQ
jgi:ssDNA-binding Zn-finger/Zn-ribbon topoisomerase 1